MTEQDWCPTCDEPQDIVDVSDEVDVQTIDGRGPAYRVYHLACGHSIDIPTGRWS